MRTAGAYLLLYHYSAIYTIMTIIVKIQTNIPLSTLTTMRIGGAASYVADVTTDQELRHVVLNSQKMNQRIYVIGGGSNLIAPDEGFPGIIIRNKIMGIAIVDDNPSITTLNVGAGESWDDLVKYTVDMDLQGIEAMSGIPGTVGAAPVQNIGAYGQELSDTLISLEAYDTTDDTFVTLSWDDCNFGYRSSIFRTTHIGRYIITHIRLTLNKKKPEPPFYDAIEKYFASHNDAPTPITVQAIRQAVLNIRSDKLPDPSKLPNAGSFFKNPIIEKWKADDLQRIYQNVPTYPIDDNHVKIPAGWLIETAELKGSVLHGMKVHTGNAVVLINESAKNYADLAAAREKIIYTISDKFQITLEQEPLEINPTQ